ncbi:MAG: TadG family pilus assembly protein [Acetobacteraceae bacterium]|jgi:Flp pilus assembly protein TadG
MKVLQHVPKVARTLRHAKASWQALSRSKKGSIAIMAAVSIPTLIMLGGLSVDQSYVTVRVSMLRHTAQDAALAGEQYMANYLETGSSTQLVSAAQSIATANLPVAQYGTVVPAANVVLGTWNSSTQTFTATTTNPSAVKVTALNTVANSNPVYTLFGGAYGRSTVDLTSSAVAVYGTGQAFNTILLNDLSMSFSSEIADQRTADVAILNCIVSAASSTSQIGLTSFNGHSDTLYALANAVTTQSAMTTYINKTLNYCGNKNMPSCSGSNLAAGLYSAITQLTAAKIANANSNIIVITDGVPNADNITYTQADGTYPTPTSKTPVCSTSCTDADLWTMAQDQAAYAKTLGINISTIYYSGDTQGASTQAEYAADLASLISGTGIALVAPSASKIDSSFGAFCASMGAAVGMVQ